jgi:hypothetical protein
MFIDNSYFIGDINLPAQLLNNIQTWINRTEKDILVKLLGYHLYKEFIADLDESNVPQSDKFVKLLSGDEFSFVTYQGNTVNCEWRGLVDSDLKQSVLAYYCFFQFMNYNNTQITTTGHKRTKAENAEYADIRMRLVDAWNNMQTWYGSSFDYLGKDELYLNQSNYEHSNAYPSAFNYLLAKKADFTNWVFTPQDRLNYMGI